MTGKYWPSTADAKARQILREHADDLYREAERVTQRVGSDTVAPGYVEEAAHTIRVRRTSGGASDVLMSVGTTVAGIGGGALIATAAESGDPTTGWVAWASIAMLVVGSIISAVGGTAKWLTR